MIQNIIFIGFLVILFLSAVQIIKKIVGENKKINTNVSAKIKSIGQSEINSIHPKEPNYDIENTFVEEIRKKSTFPDKIPFITKKNVFRLAFLLTLVYVAYFYSNKLQIAYAYISHKFTINNVKNKKTVPNSNKCSVNGVNWYKVVVSDAKGKKITGWVSEFSIKAKPPEASTALNIADKIRKKIGLPTTEEQLKNIKNLKKVSAVMKRQVNILRKSQH